MQKNHVREGDKQKRERERERERETDRPINIKSLRNLVCQCECVCERERDLAHTCTGVCMCTLGGTRCARVCERERERDTHTDLVHTHTGVAVCACICVQIHSRRNSRSKKQIVQKNTSRTYCEGTPPNCGFPNIFGIASAQIRGKRARHNFPDFTQ